MLRTQPGGVLVRKKQIGRLGVIVVFGAFLLGGWSKGGTQNEHGVPRLPEG